MVGTGSGPGLRTAVVSLRTSQRRWIEGLDGAAGTRYLPTGHLVFASSDELFAVRFDAGKLAISGTPVSVERGVYGTRSGTFATFSHFAVSSTGTLAFVPGGTAASATTLVWMDRAGSARPVAAFRGSHFYPHVSPDGRFVAVQEENDIWVYDSERGTRSRVTTRGGTDPVWAPDGQRIVFSAAAGGRMSLFSVPSDGSGDEELLLTQENPVFAHSFAPDGSVLAFYEVTTDRARDIWLLVDRGSAWEPEPFLATPANERSPSFSPNGRWLAYVSDESGRDEIYVQPYPGPGAKIPISRDGGREPVWARSGGELFYRQGDRVIAVPLRADGSLAPAEPTVLFSGGLARYFSASGSQTYDVAPDGQRFVMAEAIDVPMPRQINVVINWIERVAELVPG